MVLKTYGVMLKLKAIEALKKARTNTLKLLIELIVELVEHGN
jgi:hypothetical protein